MESLGPYELLSPIGQGGMAEVWLARRSMAGGPGKLVAIKRMAAGLASQEHYREMFEAETRMSMTLSHSNIVQVFDYGTEQGNAYIVMELVDGVDLGSLVSYARQSETGGILPLKVTAFVVGELLRALSYSHNLSISSARLGLIHRDVSPQNLLISKAGEVKLTDFGVARLVDENTSGAQPKGKLRYMAPEQMSGQGMDARVDLFAVGTILFELLTGRHYRDADSVDQLYGQILNPSPVQLPDHLPPDLIRITTQLLAAKAEDRIATARDARKQLTAWSGYGDARDELAQLVRECRPEALVIPPPRDHSSVGYRSTPPESAAVYAGHTQAMPSPSRAAAGQGGQTLPNSVPEHTTLPDTTSASGSVVGFSKARSRRNMFAIAGAVAFAGTGGVLLIKSQSSGDATAPVAQGPAPTEVKPSSLTPSQPPSGGTPVPANPAGAGGGIQPGSIGTPGTGEGSVGGGAPKQNPGSGIDSRDQGSTPTPKEDESTDTEKESSSRKKETPRQKRRRELRELRRQRAAKAREARLRNNDSAKKPDARTKVSVVFKAHEFNYAYVKMAGKELLIEPLGSMKVSPGRHTVYARESKSDPWRSFGTVQVREGERTVVRLRRSGSVRVSRSTP